MSLDLRISWSPFVVALVFCALGKDRSYIQLSLNVGWPKSWLSINYKKK